MARIAFLFPGQGAQTVGMGRQIARVLPEAQRLFDEAGAILGYDLAEICWQGPVERLNSTVVSQPAIFVTSLAALAKLRAAEPAVVEQCQASAGLSLGEYTALVFAGAFSFSDGLRIVQRRGEAMQVAADATPSGMVSILGLDQSQVEDVCAKARGGETLEIANLLCPANIVVSGTQAACARAEQEGQAMGGRTVRLAVAGAFHTNLMKPADEALTAALAQVTIRPPRFPVWSNVDGKPHHNPEEIRQLLVKQVLSPVLWEQTMRNLLAAEFDVFYEIGPGRVLAGLLKRVQRKTECRNLTA
jgi:[acyl-carrier-protein] S-malonyltransferase